MERDPSGNLYDYSRVGSDGTVHYYREHARGSGGRAQWSSLDDVNPICGHHLASKCRDCGCCMACDDCWCGED